MAWIHTIVSRLRAFLQPGAHDRELDQELAAHLAMAEEEKIRQGMTPREARRAARIELGGVSQLREAHREARGLPWLDTLRLDIKLGLRMLRKSWGLTAVGGLAMTIAIAIGVIVVTAFALAFGGSLPLDEGDRVVVIQTWDAEAQRRHDTALRDLERWRDDLRSVDDVGAFRMVERNLILGEPATNGLDTTAIAPVRVAEMTASGFRLARVAPLLGRTLVAADEQPGAPPVVVIGHDVWHARFAADPAVIGQTVRLGDTAHTVVGVMPAGFAFPVSHQLWTALRPGGGGRLPADAGAVFARLAPGATLGRAQAEIATVGLLPDTEVRTADDALQTRVAPYALALTLPGDSSEIRWFLRLGLLLAAFLLIPPCANIAILVYARTLTRQDELKARHALGASRRRMVGQLFVEMLVLAALAAGAALAAVHGALRLMEASLRADGGDVPIWMAFSVPTSAFFVAAALAVLAALVAGLLPALKVTGRPLRTGLQALGSRSSVRLGATWTALVIAQVGLCVAVLPFVVEMTWGTVRYGVLDSGLDTDSYLTARLARDDGMPAAVRAELLRRLGAEPGVVGTTVGAVPRDEPWLAIELEALDPAGEGAVTARVMGRQNRVDDAYFEVFDMPVLAGRGFQPGDLGLEQEPSTVIVNRTLARQLVGDGNPLGRRIRPALGRGAALTAMATARPWYEIIGVVEDRPAHLDHGTMYHPAGAVMATPTSLAVRVGTDTAGMTDRLRRIAATVDPTLRLDEIRTLEAIYRAKQVGNNVGAFSLAAVTLSVLLLSAAGIYALTSFTVNQRRREIGIRSALGARPARLLAGVFRGAVGQLAVGAGAGMVLAIGIDHFLPAETLGGWHVPGVIPLATAFMVLVALVAAIGPARRGMRVDPIEELREG